jgi:hypothetical protein
LVFSTWKPSAPHAAIPLAGWFQVDTPVTFTGPSGSRKNSPETSSAKVSGSPSGSAVFCASQHGVAVTSGRSAGVVQSGQTIFVTSRPAPLTVRPFWSTQTASS